MEHSCTATDPNVPADVETCGNVNRDGMTISTCQSAGACTYTPAAAGADISGDETSSRANCLAVPGRCSYFAGGADGSVITSASTNGNGISTVGELGAVCAATDKTVQADVDFCATVVVSDHTAATCENAGTGSQCTYSAGSIASGFGSIQLSSPITGGDMKAGGTTTIQDDTRLAACAIDACSVLGDFTLCTDVTGAQSCVASGVACGCGTTVNLGMSAAYDASLPEASIAFNGRVHGILLQQVSGSYATAARCAAVTLPTNQATCEAAGRCTYTAADPSAVPAVAESCSPSATRMVFPNLDDPTKVLNVIFNA